MDLGDAGDGQFIRTISHNLHLDET